MATAVSNSVPLPLLDAGNGTLADEFLNGLLQGGSWQFPGASTLTYSFSLNTEPDDPEWSSYPGLQSAVVAALGTWSAVANISFAESGSGTVITQSSADLAITLEDFGDPFVLGIGVFPDPTFAAQFLLDIGMTPEEYPNPEGDIDLNIGSPQLGGPAIPVGSAGFAALLHEIGHALGLKHTDDDGGNARAFADLGLTAYDSAAYTVMQSVLPASAPYAVTPMLLDILAIQHIYGANTTYRTGNDSYEISPYERLAVWDAGGNDQLWVLGDAAARPVLIDLRPGSVSGFTDTTEMVTAIAFGATIENARGGSANDSLIGNDANNVLDGFGGADTMIGGLGDDLYRVSSAGDTIVELAGAGTDTVESEIDYVLGSALENLTLWIGSTAVNATGNGRDNFIKGSVFANVLRGGAGNDTLQGIGGLDTLFGGAGDDLFLVDVANVRIGEAATGGIDSVQSSVTFTLAANLENLTLLSAGGSINGTGNAGNNVLTGNLWGNTLNGGLGADILVGGDGSDTYVIDDAGDLVIENGGEADIDQVSSSVAYALGNALEHLTLTGANAIDGAGNDGNNDVTGNAAGNRLDGQGGRDRLYGRQGNDSLFGGQDADILTGEGGKDFLDGGEGFDWMAGGPGNDTYIVDTALETYGLAFSGEAGELISRGRAHHYSAATGNFSSQLADVTGDAVVDQVTLLYSDPDHFWRVRFGTANLGQNLVAGHYGNARVLEALLGSPAVAEISVTGDGTGAGAFYGSFTVHHIEVDYSGGQPALLSFSADFEQVNFSNAALRGTINYNYVGGATERVVELAGEGTDEVQSFISAVLPENIERLTLAGAVDTSATGNAAGNRLAGNSGANTLDGRAGADTMIGGLGSDVYFADDVLDLVIESSHATLGGIDEVRSSVTRTLGSYQENLTLIGASAINGTGNGLDNVITGNDAANVLNGAGGRDTLIGGASNDIYVVSQADDVVVELDGGGTDLVKASVTYALAADTYVEKLLLTGSADIGATGNIRNNVLIGNAGGNLVSGGGGTDSLYGKGGTDTLIGGAGADRFYFDTVPDAGNVDLITDFQPGVDRIYVDDDVFTQAGAVGGLAPANFVLGAAATDAAHRLVYDPAGGGLYYDADGAGGASQVQFATLGSASHPSIGAGDIFIVA